MSTNIDQNIVEMRFDNKHFEQNVSTTMSTLDKLKAKLGFSGATKGLEDVGRAAKNVDMSSLSNGAETVGLKFNAMYTMADQALRNITNSVMNTGKRMLSALTIDPIKTGFSEYELKMDSIKTIMASTGKEVGEVNALLNELNEYSDQTIYSFADMTQNIGKFTNAGVKLEDAVLAIKGISNEAAVSGANAAEASRAMYNFAQALSAGYVKLIDWKSIENANMATVEFKQQLIDTAVELGTVTEAADGMYKTLDGHDFNATKNFNDVLQDQWMTTDVLIKTLGQYADKTTEIGAKAFAAAQDVTKFTQVWDILKETAQSGWSRTWELIIGDIEQAKALLTPLTNTLSGIINSFSDARNNLLEEVLGSKWNKLTEKINVAGVSTEEFEKRSRAALEEAGYDVDELLEKYGSFEKIFKAIPNGIEILQKALSGLTGGVQGVVDKLFDVSGITRMLGWGDIGEDVKQVQDALEKLGFSLEKFGVDGIIGPETTKAIKDFQKMAEITADGIVGPETLEALEKFNTVTKETVDTNGDLVISYEELQAAFTKKSGRELLVETFTNAGNGLLGVFKAIKEAWQWIFPPKSLEERAAGLYKVLETINKFSEKLKLTYTETNEETGEVTKHLNENGKKLMRTFRGIFAIVSVVSTILGGAFRIALKVITEILGYFNLNLLDVTAVIGDALVEFKEWFDSIFSITKLLDMVAPVIENIVEATKDWFAAFKASKGMQDAIDYINKLVQSVKDWWANLKNSEDMPKTIAEGIVNAFSNIPKIISTIFGHLWDAVFQSFSGGAETPFSSLIASIRKGMAFAGDVLVELGKILLDKLNNFLSAKGFKTISEDSIAGLVNGLKEGGSKVWNAAVEMAKALVQKVEDFLGIQSPSRVFYAIGGFIVAGLIAGLQNGIPDSLGAVKDLFQPMLDWIKGIDFGAVLAGVIGIGTVNAANKTADAFLNLTEPLSGVGEVLESSAKFIDKMRKPIKQVVKGFASIEKATAFNIRMEGVKTLVLSLLMLVGAIVVLALLPIDKLWNAVGVIFALSVILFLLSLAMDKLGSTTASFNFKDGFNMDGLKTGLIAIGTALLLVAASVALIGSLKPEEAEQGFLGLAKVIAGIIVVITAFGILAKLDAANDFDKFGKMMTKLAVALLLLSLVMHILGSMDKSVMKQGFIAIAIFTGIIISLMAATRLIGAYNVEHIGGTLLKIAIAIGVMALIAKSLGGMDRNALVQGTIAIAAFAAIVVGLMAATALFSKGDKVDQIGATILKLGIAIGIMALVAKMLGEMDQDALVRGTTAIAIFGGIVVGLIAATRLMASGKRVKSIAGTLLAISGAIAIMAGVSILLGMASWEGLAKGTIMMTAFAGIMVGLMAATKLIGGSKNVKQVGSTLISIAAAIGILALIAVLLGLVSMETLMRGTAIVTILGAIMTGLIAVTKNANKCLGNIIAITVAIAVIAAAAYLLSEFADPARVINAAQAISIMLVSVALALAATKDAKGSIGAVTAIVTVLLVVAGVVYLLSSLNVEASIATAVSIGVLMLALAGVMKILAKTDTDIKKAFKSAIGLAALAIPLMAFAAVLAYMPDIENGINNVVVLSVLMYTMTGVIALLSLLNPNVGAAVTGAIALTLLVIPLLAFVGVLSLMQNIENAMANVQVLVLLAGALSLMLIPLTIVGTFAAQALTGVIALTLMAAPLLAFVGVLALMNGVDNAMVNAMLLITLITAISDVLFKISLVAPLAVIAVAALTALGGLMVAFGVLAGAIGALVTDSQLQTFLDTGVQILIQLASGLGQVIGAFITGFATEVMTLLPALGTCLSQFMENAMGFITGAKLIDESVLTGVGNLAGAILALTVVDFIAGVSSFLQFGSSFADLGTQLSQFMINATPFIIMASMITPEMLSGVKALAETILIITAADILQGLTSFITGGSSLETFAQQLPILGQGLAGFATSLGTFTEEQLTTVNCAAQAIKTLAAASQEIPNTGGLLGAIVGENDLGTFAAQFPKLGYGLWAFLFNLGTFTDEQVATINCAAEAIKTLAAASSEIPNQGGLLADIVGDNSLETFADQFPPLGTGLRGFLTEVKTFTDAEVKTVDCAASAIKSLAAASSEIPNQGGWWSAIAGDNVLGTFADDFPKLGKGLRGLLTELGELTPEQANTISWAAKAVANIASIASNIPDSGGWWSAIAGDNDLGDFADKFPSIGTGLRGMIDNIGAFSVTEVATINASVNALKAIAGLANANLDDISSRMSGLSTSLPALGTAVNSFCTNLPGSKSISSAVSGLKLLLSAIDEVGKAKTGTLATFIADLGRLGTEAVYKFISAFTSGDNATKLKTAASNLGQKVIDGISSKERPIESAATRVAGVAVDGVETQKDDMESAGKDLGSGLVTGINAKQTAAYNAGYALGQKAVQGEKDGQQSKSPSKLTIQAGKWLGEGLVIGIGKMGNSVYKAGSTLGKTATSTISSSIAKIANLVDADIDSQPTIRPVLDLSDVRTGVNALSGMLNMDSSVGIRGNIDAINYSMQHRSQNGVNDAVVSAIDKLNKKMDNLGNTTYTINGITYDDGSNITDAVRTLVRAARIEGRV